MSGNCFRLFRVVNPVKLYHWLCKKLELRVVGLVNLALTSCVELRYVCEFFVADCTTVVCILVRIQPF